ncbi:GNAT family N-acetyltransferase [Comamonas sp. GB3 AK4-5]|uniref:GNAT family N-acetyltransferase n=1 Tax=Comamonas sp. GB3 AK4-5 TaxID=3231487 RepID=UPI00351F3743
MTEKTIITRVFAAVQEIAATAWDALLAQQATPTPFMRHAYLAALQQSGSATADTGWDARFITLWQSGPQGEQLLAACPLYVKNHSWGEYVFDMAWARAYDAHGLPYYPKAVVAVPFTPVPGSRLLATSPQWRVQLVHTVQAWCAEQGLSSAHVLFGDATDHDALRQAGWMARSGVQFHWKNMTPTLPTACGSLPPEGAASDLGRPGGGWTPTLPAAGGSLPPEGAASDLGRPGGEWTPTLPAAGGSLPPEGAASDLGRPGGEWAPTLPTACGSLPPEGAAGRDLIPNTGRPYVDFDDFLAGLQQAKRKKIRQERQKVAQAGVQFQVRAGREISEQDWDFFYACYAQTYHEHGNPPYLQRDFFTRMARDLPGHWVLFIAEQAGRRMACSLIAASADATPLSASKDTENSVVQAQTATESEATPTTMAQPLRGATAYGRYWGALARVDCLHFEACYYQPLQWCIQQGLARFEGGAQGEHKMARALLPEATASYHWLAHPAFADAVGRFLEREGEGMAHYMQELEQHSPLRQAAPLIR